MSRSCISFSIGTLAFVFAVVFILPFTVSVSSVKAQPSFFFKYKAQYEQAESGSQQQLDAIFKMVDVAFHYDLDLALEWSAKARDIARASDARDAEAAALMDLSLWTAYKEGAHAAHDLFDEANEKFDPNGTPCFVAQFYSARFGYSMINEEEEYDPNRYLSEVKEIAEKLQDPHLMVTYLYMAATSKVFIGKLPPTDESISQIRKQLLEITNKHKFETGKINSLLLDAQEARLAGDYLKALMIFNKASKYSKDKGYFLFQVRCELVLASIEMQMGYHKYIEQYGSVHTLGEEQLAELAGLVEPARDRYRNCLKIARRVKMASYIFDSLVDLAFTEFHCGNVDLAKSHIEEAQGMDYECFRSWSMRDRLYRHAVVIYASDLNSQKSLEYADLLASPEHIEKAEKASGKVTRYRQLLAQVESDNEAKYQAHEEIRESLVAESEQQKSRADRLQSILGVSGLLVCLAGSIGALFWNRKRLKMISSELTTEKENSRINREMRDVLQERVIRLQRMESLGMLAGGIAHDFNNLLVGVMCNAEILETQADSLDPFSNERVQCIIESAEKAADLSRQMLAYTGKQEVEKRAVDLNEITTNMTRILAATAGELCDFSVRLHDEEVVASVDETQIEQILLNLVSNSRNASDEKSKVAVATGVESISEIEKDSTLHGKRETGGEFVYIEVEDSGHGLDDSDCGRIFEPFFSGDEKGRGLGLSVVYGIVNGHDGFIRVTNREEGGARFRILFPKSDTLPSTSEKVLRPHLKTAKADSFLESRRILVVDDEESVRDLTRTLLIREGWKTETAVDGSDGLKKLVAKPDAFDCVLLDVVMPNMGAKEVLSELESLEISLPIVLMSGYSDIRLEQFRDDHANVQAIVAKPFRLAALLKAVNEAAEKSTGSQAKPKLAR